MDDKTKTPILSWLALFAIILTALVVRLWGNSYGLPHIYHTDEIFEIKRALKLGAGVFDTNRAFKGGLFYILFVEYGLYYVVLKVSGVIQSTPEFLARFFTNPTGFWLIGRTTVALIGALNVFFIYLVGKRYRSRNAGVLAALFLAFSYEHVDSSHYITVDILMVTFLTLSFFYVLGMVRMGSRRSYILAALYAALATMTKFPAIIILLSIVVAHGGRMGVEKKRHASLLLDPRILLAAVTFLGATLIGNPGFFTGLPGFLSEHFRFVPNAVSTLEATPPFIRRTENIPVFYVRVLMGSMGLPVFLLSIGGLLQVLRRRTIQDLSLLAFVVVSFLLTCFPSQENLVYSRYIIPIQLVLLVLAAGFADSVFVRLPARLRSRLLLGIVAMLVVAPPIVHTLRHDFLMTRKDTRTQAKEWVDANILPGASIVIEGRGYRPSTDTVPLNNRPSNIMESISRCRNGDGRWRSDGDYGMLKDQFHLAAVEAIKGQRTYDLMLLGPANAGYARLEDYLERGAEYVIIDTHKREFFPSGINYERFPSVGDFYRDTQDSSRLQLMKRFEPTGCLGPTLEIYEVKKARTVIP